MVRSSIDLGVETFNWPENGVCWSVLQETSGSFGASRLEIAFRSLGQLETRGRPAWVFEYDGIEAGTQLRSYYSLTGSLLMVEQAGRAISTYRPGFQLFTWPLRVGATWTEKFTYEDGDGRIFPDNVSTGAVECVEQVRTPAGAFEAFRISVNDAATRKLRWYAPEPGLFVKTRAERLDNFYLGAGLMEQVVSAFPVG